MEEPLANQAFFNSRLIGAMFVHAGEKYHTTASVFAENDAMKMTADKLGNEAWGAMTRLVWRPYDRARQDISRWCKWCLRVATIQQECSPPFHLFTFKSLFTLSSFLSFTFSPFHPFTFSPFHLFTLSPLIPLPTHRDYSPPIYGCDSCRESCLGVLGC